MRYQPRISTPIDLQTVFDNCQINIESGCMEWQGKYDTNIPVLGRTRLPRQIWEQINNGKTELRVIRDCGNHKCLNPKHFIVSTMQHIANINKAIGELNGRHILTAAEVKEIRLRYLTSNTSHRLLAREYEVHKSTIGNVVRGKTWQQVA